MDLGLDVFRTSGRPAAQLDFAEVGPLSDADIAALQLSRGVQAPPLKRLSQRHHSLARNLAAGMPVGEAAIICGYDISRVSILQGDPTFQELLKFYSLQVDAQYANLHESLSALSVDAAEELRTRLEENPDDLSTGALIDIVKMSADRTGMGPQTKSEVSVVVGMADRLRLARERVSARQIEANAVDITPTPKDLT
jgi:hypothetical protein